MPLSSAASGKPMAKPEALAAARRAARGHRVRHDRDRRLDRRGGHGEPIGGAERESDIVRPYRERGVVPCVASHANDDAVSSPLARL
jgi:hypothetical protein